MDDLVLYVTDEPNDRDLANALGPAAIVLPVKHGDVNFYGYADGDGKPIRVCVERKHLRDLCGCIYSGRYLAQVRAAYAAGFRYQVLVVEADTVRPGPDTGLVETLAFTQVRQSGGLGLRQSLRRSWQAVTPRISYSQFDQFLTEIQRDLGVIYKRSHNVAETAAIIHALWRNCQRAPDQHHSLRTFYTPAYKVDLLQRPGLVRRVAKELSGVGWERSGEIARRFRSVQEMCSAGVSDWMQIPGIGRTLARRIVCELRGEPCTPSETDTKSGDMGAEPESGDMDAEPVAEVVD